MHDQITDLRFASKSILKSAASSSRFLVARWQIHRQRGFMAWVNVSGTRHSSKNGHSTYKGRERVTAVGTRLEEHRATLQENFVGAIQCTLATPWCLVRNTSVDFLLKQLNVKRMGKVLFSILIPFYYFQQREILQRVKIQRVRNYTWLPHTHNFFLTIFIA